MRRTCLAFAVYLFGLTASGWSQATDTSKRLSHASWGSPLYPFWPSARRGRRRPKEPLASAKGPTEAIAELLAEELRYVVLGLPDYLQESVPKLLQDSTRLARDNRDTPKGRR